MVRRLAKLVADRRTGHGLEVHRRGWRAYWRWRSRRGSKAGRPPIPPELRDLIRRMATENQLWGQRRIQAELARLGFRVSARSIAKYMRRPWDGEPSPGWRAFLKRHASTIWACDFLCVHTIFFQTVYVFFVVDHASRAVLRVETTRHPTAEWASRQIVECCGWDREPPRFLIHDRDGRSHGVVPCQASSYGTIAISSLAGRSEARARSQHAIHDRINFRGRDRHCCPPPAQNPASPI